MQNTQLTTGEFYPNKTALVYSTVINGVLALPLIFMIAIIAKMKKSWTTLRVDYYPNYSLG